MSKHSLKEIKSFTKKLDKLLKKVKCELKVLELGYSVLLEQMELLEKEQGRKKKND